MSARPCCRQFFLNGKTLPINRKRGTDQPIMHIAAELVRRGDWLHVFPEARGFVAGSSSQKRESDRHQYTAA